MQKPDGSSIFQDLIAVPLKNKKAVVAIGRWPHAKAAKAAKEIETYSCQFSLTEWFRKSRTGNPLSASFLALLALFA
jgi:hypothetical protein